MTTIVVIIFFLVIVAALVATTVKIVHPYQRGVIERLGRYKSTVDPGLKIILPFVDTLRAVDIREQVIDVPPQEVITQDNVTAAVDAVVYYEPTDPQRLLYNVNNFILAVTKLAQTNLRNVIGEMSLDEAFTSRERVNLQLRAILDDATDKWGVRVVRVEIQRIDPPADVMNAMHEQMKAERTRRAVVLEADGAREAAIAIAEGDKQSAILRAEGAAQAVILEANAEQERLALEGQGEAKALIAIKEAAIDDSVLGIKYLDMLETFASGNSTKVLIPNELAGLSSAFLGILEAAGAKDTQKSETSRELPS